MPIGNLGPFTPGHCSVCKTPVPKVDDPNPSVRKWARHLNYMEHLKKYHPEYYSWSKRWTNILYLPLIPFVVLAYVSGAERSTFLLFVTALVTVIPYVPLLVYRWRRVHAFREAWDHSASTSEESRELAHTNS